MSGDRTGDWDCEAYGPDIREVGALCFVAGDLGKRVCGSLGECRRVMAAERRRVFRRISELAANGDETAAYLAEEFTNPEQILGGGQEADNGT